MNHLHLNKYDFLDLVKFQWLIHAELSSQILLLNQGMSRVCDSAWTLNLDKKIDIVTWENNMINQ